jgi:acetyl-CoA C-acetyltransferase
VKTIKIKSSYMTRFGRRADDWTAIAIEAAEGALATTDLSRVKEVYVASYAPIELCAIQNPVECLRSAIQGELPGFHARYHGIYKTGGHALIAALDAMNRSVAADPGEVLVLGVEKMTHRPPAETAGFLSQRENPHDRAYGATLPALGALVTRAYMETHGVPESALHRVAVKNHRHGSMNPKAHFREAVTMEKVAASPLVCDPLRRLHCAPTSDGGAAVLLSAVEGDVRYRGWARGTDVPLFQEREDISRFVATAEAARLALNMARVRCDDADVVEIHDAFASFELINLEELGFFPRGSSWMALEGGGLGIGSRPAVNTSGGMKAKGHPIGCTGISASVEIHEQLTHRAGPRQQRDARLGMIQSAGGVSNESFVLVIDLTV